MRNFAIATHGEPANSHLVSRVLFLLAEGIPMQRALLLDDEEIERTILETILTEAEFVVCASSISMTPSLPDGDRYFDIAILDLSASAQNES